MAALPNGGPMMPVTDSVSPSGSVSFARTAIVMAVSSGVVLVSFTATGPSFTLATITLTVAVALPFCPSPIV